MPKRTKTTKKATAKKTRLSRPKTVPTGPVKFLMSLIKGREAHNTDIGHELFAAQENGQELTDKEKKHVLDPEKRYGWVHQSYTPLQREGEDKWLPLRDAFIREGIPLLKFPPRIVRAAAKLDYDKGLSLYVATVQAAVASGEVTQRGVQHGYSLCITADWEAELKRRGVKRAVKAPKSSASEVKANLLSQLG